METGSQASSGLPFVVLAERNLIVIRCQSRLRFEQIIANVPEFMKHPRFCAGMNVLYDFSDLEHLDGDLQILIDSVEPLNSAEFIPVPARTMFYVTDQPSIERMLHGFCIMTSYTRVEHRVTHDLKEAWRFLKVDDDLSEADLDKLFSQ